MNRPQYASMYCILNKFYSKQITSFKILFDETDCWDKSYFRLDYKQYTSLTTLISDLAYSLYIANFDIF